MNRINQCYYAPGIAKRTKPSSVQKVQKVQKGWRGGLQSDRQSHRLVITRSRLTKPHDSAVSHEPPYMCAEATLIAFVIAQRPHAEDGARFEPLCTACDASTSRIATSLRRPSVAFAATSQRRNFFSFLVCFPFSSSFSCQDRACEARCLHSANCPMSQGRVAVEAGSG